jgi:PAS domain-containing protein
MDLSDRATSSRLPTQSKIVETARVKWSIRLKSTLNETVMDNEINSIQPSEDFLRTMIDKIPTLAWSCWPDGITEFLNQRWLDYTGLSMEEALGWGWKAVIHSEDLENLMATCLGLLASGEHRRVRPELICA